MRKKLLERLSWNERGQSRANTDQVMDEQIEKKNKLLEEDPDDFDTKSSLFTDESKVRMQWNSKATERVCKLFLLFRQRRMIANELVVEDIVRERSLQVFRSKCKVFDTSSLELKSQQPSNSWKKKKTR